jgi:membrane-bound metal-dependent hydrolase YbcI (DUF457 family)
MRRQVHLFTGAVAFLAYTCLLSMVETIPASTILMGLFAVLFGSVMPDVLEPPVHWTHRGLFHSRGAMKLAAGLFAVCALSGLLQGSVRDLTLAYLASGFFLGYTLHLLTDSATPAGLPG